MIILLCSFPSHQPLKSLSGYILTSFTFRSLRIGWNTGVVSTRMVKAHSFGAFLSPSVRPISLTSGYKTDKMAEIFLLILLFIGCWAFPESPRWLTKVGRGDEARYILGRLRGEDGEDAGKADAEYQDVVNIVQLEKEAASEQHYYKMFFGIGSGKLHTGRRVQLVIWLQIMQEWIGIAVSRSRIF